MSPLPGNDNSDTLLSLAMYIVEFKASSSQLHDIHDKFDYTNTCTSILVYINRKGIGKHDKLLYTTLLSEQYRW